MIVRNQFKSLLCLMLYKASLDLSYYLLVPNIEYYAVTGLNFNIVKLVESYLLALSVFTVMPKSSKKLSNITVWLLILFSYIPMLTIFAFQDRSRIFMYAATIFWLEVFSLLSYMPAIYMPPVKESQATIIRFLLFIFLLIAVLLSIHKYLKFSFNFFDLVKAYDFRSIFVMSVPTLERYPFYWLATGLNPIFFAFYITRKKWILAGLIVFIEFIIASTVGQRTYFFILVYVLGLMWIITQNNPLVVIEMGLAAVIIGGIIFYYVLNITFIYLFFTARDLLVPAQLSFLYYDFFSTHGPIPFAYIFKFYFGIPYFLEYPYDLSPPFLIGEKYFSMTQLVAVTGIIGDAYMNLGLLGLALWAIILAIFLKLLDGCSKRLSPKIGVAAGGVSAISITNTYLIRAFLTSGLLLSLLLLYLMRTNKE